jgi:outer membrane protein, adhesin transport system
VTAVTGVFGLDWARLARTFLLLAVSACSVGSAAAQVVTWIDVVRAAQASHPQVLGKQAGQAAARAEWQAANWQRYPTPSVEAGSLGGVRTQTLRLDQPVWTAGRIDASIVASEWRHAAATAAVDEARRDVTWKALLASAEAARQTERQHVAERALTEHERLLALIQRRVAQEVSPAADEILARARLAAARTDLSLARQGVRQALLQLSQLMGQKVSQLDERHYAQTASSMPGPVLTTLPSERELAQAPVLRRLSAEVDVAVSEAEEKRAQQWPQLILRLERVNGAVADSRAGFILSFQPGAGLSAQAGLAAALAKREGVREALAAARREQLLQLEQIGDDWSSARERLVTAEATRRDTGDVVASYTRQYTVGRKSWLDVLNALRESQQSELAWVDVQHQVWSAQMRWHAVMGGFDNLSALPGTIGPEAPLATPSPIQ